MSRKKAKKGLGWYKSVEKVYHGKGFSSPVFIWSYGLEESIQGGRVEAWPIKGIFIFRDNRGGFILTDEDQEGRPTSKDGHVMAFLPSQLDELIKILTNSYEGDNPSYINEVAQDIVEMDKALQKILKTKAVFVKIAWEIGKICIDLKKKWEGYHE